MTAINHHSPSKRSAPNQHRELHLRPIRQAYFRPESEITDGQRRLDDKAVLLLAVGTGDAAHIDMHRLAMVARPIPIDCKPHEALAIAGEIIEHMGVERAGARTGIDLGGDAGKAKFGQADEFPPAHHQWRLRQLQLHCTGTLTTSIRSGRRRRGIGGLFLRLIIFESDLVEIANDVQIAL